MLKQMIALTALMVSSIAFAQDREYVIVVHGGAGAMAGLEEDPVKSAQYYAALDSALMVGRFHHGRQGFKRRRCSWLKTREASDQCRLCRKDKISACHAERSRC